MCPIGVVHDALGVPLPVSDGDGLNVCNIPLGSDGYVRQFLDVKRDAVLSQIQTISEGLQAYANEAWCALFYSSAHQWDYWMSHVLPRDSRAHSLAIDDALIEAAKGATGVDVGGDDTTRRRLRLPARLKGAGVRSHVETTPAAFCGSVNQAVPRLIDYKDEAGELVSGFFPPLAAVLGAGSFDSGNEAARYGAFVASGLAIAAEFAAAWDDLRAEAGDRATDEECALFYDASGARGLQRELTFVVERQRRDDLAADIAALPVNNNVAAVFRRMAWVSVDKSSAVWVSSIPTKHMRAGPVEFREICATYFGAPSPVASALAGQTIFGKDGTARGVCDQFGLKLASARLDGRWNVAHDGVKFAIAAALDTLGVGYMSEVHGIFTPAIPPAAQARARRFMQGRPCGGGPNGQRQGLVPDFRIDIEGLADAGAASTAALAELKILRCGSTARAPVGGSTYPTHGVSSVFDGHRRAVHARAASIQAERERDARRIDARFCDTQPGDDGPVLQRLRSFGPILSLVVGAFGEWNDGLERLLSFAADAAPPRMRALLGAQSDRDSRSRCAALFRKEVAWAGLNENAKLKVGRAEFVGWDARTASERRQQQARREEARRATFAWASAAWESARDSYDADGAHGRAPWERDAGRAA